MRIPKIQKNNRSYSCSSQKNVYPNIMINIAKKYCVTDAIYFTSLEFANHFTRLNFKMIFFHNFLFPYFQKLASNSLLMQEDQTGSRNFAQNLFLMIKDGIECCIELVRVRQLSDIYIHNLDRLISCNLVVLNFGIDYTQNQNSEEIISYTRCKVYC